MPFHSTALSGNMQKKPAPLVFVVDWNISINLVVGMIYNEGLCELLNYLFLHRHVRMYQASMT